MPARLAIWRIRWLFQVLCLRVVCPCLHWYVAGLCICQVEALCHGLNVRALRQADCSCLSVPCDLESQQPADLPQISYLVTFGHFLLEALDCCQRCPSNRHVIC